MCIYLSFFLYEWIQRFGLYVCHNKLFITALLCLEPQLKKVVDALPRKLIVFVTHHHRDHIGGMESLVFSLSLVDSFVFLPTLSLFVNTITIYLFIHVSGLSAIQESNPDAVLVAHVKTRNRIGIILQYSVLLVCSNSCKFNFVLCSNTL